MSTTHKDDLLMVLVFKSRRNALLAGGSVPLMVEKIHLSGWFNIPHFGAGMSPPTNCGGRPAFILSGWSLWSWQQHISIRSHGMEALSRVQVQEWQVLSGSGSCILVWCSVVWSGVEVVLMCVRVRTC